MSKYCCFFCPESDYSERELTDKCPSCGRLFNFPIINMPNKINEYKITKSVGRGFYGSAYVATGRFNRQCVLKLTPKSFYDFEQFNKTPFEEECQQHSDLASKADHVVQITNGFESDVTFGDESSALPCNVMVLDYVDGELLKEYISGGLDVTVPQLCQITIDLLTAIKQFRDNEANHNDLHDENLIVERVPASARRMNAICDSLKVMVIDLGSISSGSKSSVDRAGDLRFAIQHIGKLLDKLLKSLSEMEDKDYRIALKLQSLISYLTADPQNLRLDIIPNLIAEVYDVYGKASRPFRPWKEDHLGLTTFSDHNNAQTLESWNVPYLLVDPGHRWLSKVTIGGPQIITGMRGCGKTMLLRALDIHARINQHESETSEQIMARVKEEKYVGLFVSAQKIMGLKQDSLRSIESKLTRLFVNYALEATRALLHIQDLDRDILALNAHKKIGAATADYLTGGEYLKEVLSLDELERQLTAILVDTNSESGSFLIKGTPSDFFPHLASAIRESSELFESSNVYYLLDDVSTRYHSLDRIGELVTTLLFQSPHCAFKFTTEWQTIELGLKSPGNEHPIRVGRDIDIFDLGVDVHETIKGTIQSGLTGTKFVASVLEKRAQYDSSHPNNILPIDILGDISLEQAGVEIANSRNTSADRKNAYRGISCLSKMCVGDISDVIKVYDEIARRYNAGEALPVSARIQSQCFRDMSSSRLYDLNRRKGYFKDHAVAFAEAAHELMVRSYKKGIEAGESKPRLRMYTSIYVRVTTDNQDEAKEQIDLLRELIDASVFVYTGAGSGRLKTKDSNPILQFILGFRKIYGLSSYIGLSDKDRFELSGKDLSKWLHNPASAKEILIRNQTEEDMSNYIEKDEAFDNESDAQEIEHDELAENKGQQILFASAPTIRVDSQNQQFNKLNIKIQDVDIKYMQGLPIETVLTSLGFEDRALESNKILSHNLSPKEVLGVKYSLEGHSKEIIEAWKKVGARVKEVPSDSYLALQENQGLSLIDISGLTKPFIFKSIYNELSRKGRVLVSYASAKKYYPLQEDLEALLNERGKDDYAFLEGLANILTGEEPPYADINLLTEHQSDPSRENALIAFAPTKHQRLFSLLDKRNFDWLEILTPQGDSPRDKVSRFSAEFIEKSRQRANVSEVDSRSLIKLLEAMDQKYLDLFVNSGFNVEIGMTGSKIEAVASAILAVQRKVSEAWYLKPNKFDAKRFSSGFDKISFYDISIDD